MCGIAASFRSQNANKDTLKSLEKIQHRGGSVFEIESFDDASIGANRLPIVGRLSGKQPLHNEKKTIWAVQNGEIFNHKELRSELQGLGHVFDSESDTEVLVHAYEEWGASMVAKLDSEMFAFVIYNTETRDVFAARDPLGVKPFYYAKTKEGELFFASEMKQLVQFESIFEVQEFPQGHFYLNGRFVKYFEIKESKEKLSEANAIRLIEKDIVEAVKKRVDTDLPIGVFLSGGVDSSLVMEIATRFHPDVTAIILGNEGSSDYDFAMRLCKERGYKFHAVSPNIDYKQELDEILYYLETYEPLVVRQAFANWICSREAQKLGLSIVLIGEGADELFAGYNEFSALPEKLINKGCKILTENLGAGHLKRVDRGAMRFTVETRAPLLDTKLVQDAFLVPGNLKVKKENHRITTKYILRKVAAEFLPDYIAWRYKMPFANGAGMNVGYNYKSGDGALGALTAEYATVIDQKAIKKYDLETHEERYYFKKFDEFGYTKLKGGEQRIVVKDVLQTLNVSEKKRLVVAEFDKLALYFPVYLASHKGIFDLHGLDVDFISTGGDDNTYATLLNNSAQIGLSDPLFAMFEGDTNPGSHGEIIGELVQSVPLVAVAISPNISINSLEDFKEHRIGSFQEYSTTHIVATKILKDNKISTFNFKDCSDKLINREIDIAIVLLEQAINLEALGGKIIYDFRKEMPQYLFSGFTVASTLPMATKRELPRFMASVKEALKFIKLNHSEALEIFKATFPYIRNAETVLVEYQKFWVSSLKVSREGYLKSHATWKSVYPQILKNHDLPYYRSGTPADKVLDVVNDRSVRREYPYREDGLIELIDFKLSMKESLTFFGFWGAGPKKHADGHDRKTLDHLRQYITKLEKQYPYGIAVTFILADRHAENNQYEKSNYETYISEVKAEMDARGFKTVLLSEIWKKHGLTAEKIVVELRKQSKGWWERISIAKKLEERSDDNFNGSDKLLGAQRYYVLRAMEKDILRKEYPDSIFFVYGDSLAQQIYPDMPTLYFFTEKVYYSTCPWFNLE
ncbi:MAG: ABC transporter substrate-binding protein [Candidatus Pacebacteria bacterium]|nr:ABC transporter substrate-binding protein [Candidatus Paceibacterota bacterium]